MPGEYVLNLAAENSAFYVNGIEDGTGLQSNQQAASANIKIGAAHSAYNLDLLKGQLDEIQIYNRALSLLEINIAFQNGENFRCQIQ